MACPSSPLSHGPADVNISSHCACQMRLCLHILDEM
jgi:hypothetical protein